MSARASAHAELLWCGSFVFSPAEMRAVASPLVGPLLYSEKMIGRPPLARRRVRAARRAFPSAGFMIPAGYGLAENATRARLKHTPLGPCRRTKHKHALKPSLRDRRLLFIGARLHVRPVFWRRHPQVSSIMKPATNISPSDLVCTSRRGNL
jgi:hypothetical protein